MQIAAPELGWPGMKKWQALEDIRPTPLIKRARPPKGAGVVWHLRCSKRGRDNMQSCTRYLDGKRFETTVGKHRIITDQPASNGGVDAGPTPPRVTPVFPRRLRRPYAVEYLIHNTLSTSPAVEVDVSVAQNLCRPA
jgi:hypothetical protein